MKSFKLGAAFALGVAAIASMPLRAAEMTLNLKDAEITSLISTVSEFTGKNFIVDGRVKGKVTVISNSPMSPAGVYQTFLAVLQVNGFAAIPAGEAIKIVPETNARQDGGTRSSNGAGLPMDEVVTHVYLLQNVSAAQLVPILRPLVPQWGHLAAYQPTNMLIISDRAANVVRLEKLIQQMDQTGDREIEYVRLQNASASEVVRILTTLTQQDKQADPSARTTSIIADERSNSVLIGGDKSDRQKFVDIIKQLDIPLKDSGATQVVYLHYASAENLAPILEGYAQQVGESSKGGAPGGNPAAAAAAASGGAGGGTFDKTRVLADKETNALIITAPPKAMRQVRDVIAQLDIQRSQVLVEAIIAEVSASKSSQLGVDWAAFNPDRFAIANIQSTGVASALTSAAAGVATTGTSGAVAAALGLLTQGITIGGAHISDNGQSGTSFAVLLHALQGDGDTNVLSTPTLVTLDNQEAKFSAGQEVPFQTGSFSSTGTTSTTGTVNPFQTIERKDVGLTLGITPQINFGGTIKLKLDLEVSGIASGTAGGANLITNKRKLTNTVGVEDGQVLVIGGLIDDQLQDTHNGVPFISSIPLIGSLFQFRSVNKQKRNLMVFIRPSILRQQDDGDYYTRLKYDAVRQAQISGAQGAVPLIGGGRPVLEPIEQYKREARPPSPDPRVQNINSPEAAPGAAIEAPGSVPVRPPPTSLSPQEQYAAPPGEATPDAPPRP